MAKKTQRAVKSRGRRPGRPGTGATALTPGEDFWKPWTPAELVAAQGVLPVADFNDLVGHGADLWDDAEFERFQTWLREGRRAGG